MKQILESIDKEIYERDHMCFFASMDRKTLDAIAENRGEKRGLELAKQIILSLSGTTKEQHICGTCKYRFNSGDSYPCNWCGGSEDYWEKSE